MHHESVYLGLGSNVGDRVAHLLAGIHGLCDRGLRLRAVSSIYLTEPDLRPADAADDPASPDVEHDHPWYLNCAVAFEATHGPDELLEACLAVELDEGRSRAPAPPAPRTLDVDVLLIGEQIVEGPAIRVPHPRMADRRFVLEPLSEIARDARHPVAGATIGELLAAVTPRERVWLLAPPPGRAC